RQQKRYLRTMIDMLPMWAWFKDTGNRYLVTNQAHAQARGHDADEMIAKTDVDLLPPPQAAAALANDAQVMDSRERRTAEELVTHVGGTVWMETYQAPVIDDDGRLLGTVGVARDITERKAAEAARESALEEARRLAQLRSDFLARMSHELRTPLNAILGFTQVLLDDREIGERATRNVVVIRQSGQHLLALINDVLDLARIDAGRIELYPEPVDLMQCLQVVADIIRVKADEKGLSFTIARAPGLPAAVMVDELRLRQVLLNLLSNAVKFTDTGQLTLRVGPAAAEPTDGSPAPAPVGFRFEVEDTGVGISEAQMTRIFEPFEQVGETRRRASGAGLGLAISRQLVNLMGGEIQVRSSEGGGSVFWFELALPACEGAVARLPANTRIVGYAGPRRRILVVDDAPILREMLTQALRVAGFEVAQAGDGAQGIEMASTWGPDLIVMDLAMPVMDGLQALRLIRKMPALAHIPVLAASAGALPEAEVTAIAAGASGFIAKPVVATVLLQSIGDLLGLELAFGANPPGAARAPAAAPHRADDDFVVPPANQIDVLHDLARVGSMRDILARAQHLESLDARYGPFAARLRGLAENYQSQALMDLLDSHRGSTLDAK
ncbi:MAG: ATP-binding protein, partial [Betaproteobacteria bacterium]